MWITKAIQLIREAVRASREPLANENECVGYAAEAYRYCTALYGMPADPKSPYDLTRGVGAHSSCCYALGRYTVCLSPEIKTLERQCAAIAHEMYHRVTMRRNGLHRQPWLDEMLAFLTSVWFLREHGFSSYADAYLAYAINPIGEIDISGLRAFRRPPWYRRLKDLGDTGYPEGFGTGVCRLAVALGHTIDANDLCRIARATTLAGWIASLPEEKQYSVCRVLEVPPAYREIPKDKTSLAQLFNALRDKGGQEAVIAEFQQIIHLQPENGNAFYYLGSAYKEAKQYDAALDAYQKASSLNFRDRWLPFSIGSAYWHKKDFSSAAHWYQEAASCDPRWGMAYYFLGRSLNNLGDVSGAREAWEKVLTLNDEHYAKLAQEALEKNPLPEIATEG